MAYLRDGCGRRRLGVEMFSNCARSETDGSSSWLFLFLGDAVLHVLRYFEHWHCCIEEMRSRLELVEFEGSLARKRHCHSFDSWNSKEASHESFVFTNHGCDLNVRIWTKPCGFRVNGGSVAEKSWLACATGAGVVALAWKCSRTARAVKLMVPGDFFSSWMMLCFCALHVLRHVVHWARCIEEMRSLLELVEFEGSLARKRHCHSFNSWNSKETSQEKFSFHESWMRFEC